MSLTTLRNLRRSGMRPVDVFVIQRECPRPEWRWLRDDVQLVWLSPRKDIRAYDLRPLVGLQVVALVERLADGMKRVAPVIKRAGGQLVGMADGSEAKVWKRHPWAPRLQELAGNEWADLIRPILVADHRVFWKL